MDYYCRTCMRDSKLFSQIFEEMTYGGISLQEALQDICQLEVSNGDELPEYVCRDCALKLYDIVKFKLEAYDVDRALRRLRVNNPHIKAENEETRDEECVNVVPIKLETVHGIEGPVSHAIVVSGTPSFLPGDTVSNPKAVSDPCEGDVNEKNICSDMESFEEEMPRLKLEDSDSEEEIVESVSDAPGCSSKDNRINSGAECSTHRLDRDVTGEKVICANGSPCNSKEWESGKEAISKTDLRKTKEKMILKEKSIVIKSSLITNSKERSLVESLYCDTCKKGFICKHSLGCHVRVHNGVRPFQCSICNRSFQTMGNLRNHNIVHNYGGPHACNQCDKSFKEEFYLKKHIEIHKKKYICKVCSKLLNSKDSLHKHMKLHGNYNKFPCIVCGRNFKCELDLNKHLQSHGRECSFTCKICGKGTSSKETLKKHQLTHNDKKPFSCNLCGKAFKLKGTLKVHSNSHEGLKHKCSVCGKDFNHMSSLYKHMKTHSKLQTYSCPKCCKTFAYSGNLKAHLKFTCKA